MSTESELAELAELAGRRRRLREEFLRPAADRPPSPGRGIHHAALICSDVRQTIEFYQGLLGFPLVELVENRDYPGSSHLFFDVGNRTLLGFFDFPGLGLEPGTESIGSVQHLALSLPREQWEQARDRLDAAGVPCLGPDRGIEESLYIKDPDGIQIELLSDPLMHFGGRDLDT
jgi:glyoxylase I family protein